MLLVDENSLLVSLGPNILGGTLAEIHCDKKQDHEIEI